jgi:hypothetical protein
VFREQLFELSDSRALFVCVLLMALRFLMRFSLLALKLIDPVLEVGAAFVCRQDSGVEQGAPVAGLGELALVVEDRFAEAPVLFRQPSLFTSEISQPAGGLLVHSLVFFMRLLGCAERGACRSEPRERLPP